MSRPTLRAAIGAALALAALCPAVASAQSSPSPALRVHAIFSGGQSKGVHVGQALFVDVRDAGGRKLTQVCMSPAPIARPACSAAHIAAPSQTGPTTVQATLSDGTKLTQTFTTLAPATKVGGPRAVPATITCQDVTLFGNYDRRRHRSRDPIETMRRGTPVGLYNVIAPGKIFMWDYATNRGGFASQACAKTAS
jgi:hypothetical protein